MRLQQFFSSLCSSFSSAHLYCFLEWDCCFSAFCPSSSEINNKDKLADVKSSFGDVDAEEWNKKV
jgi:hypothetical protein